MLLTKLKQRILMELVAGNDSFREHDLGITNRFLTEGVLALEREGYIYLNKSQLTTTYIYTMKGTQVTNQGILYIKQFKRDNKTRS